MRHRVARNSVLYDTQPYKWLPSNNVGSMDTVESYRRTSNVLGMLDVVTPNFRALQNKGVIINNPMHREEVITSFHPTYWIMDGRRSDGINIHCEYWERLRYTEVTDANAVLPDELASLAKLSAFQREIDLAVTRAWSNVDVSEAAALASIGELPETFAWLASIMTRGISLTRRVRKKFEIADITADLQALAFESKKGFRRFHSWMMVLERRSAQDLLKKLPDKVGDISNLYLEYRYAIRPLVFEMQQCLVAMSKALKKACRQTARGKEITLIDGHSNTTLPRESYSASHYVDGVVRTTEKSSVVARAGVLFEIQESINALLSVWGFDQPLEAVWELVPFSFIYDWFFSVGDVLSSWSIGNGLSPISSWVTVQHISFIEKKPISLAIANRANYVWKTPYVNLGSSYGSINRKWRVPSPPRSIIPRFDLKLNLGKILDLAAIGRSLMGNTDVPRFVRR